MLNMKIDHVAYGAHGNDSPIHPSINKFLINFIIATKKECKKCTCTFYKTSCAFASNLLGSPFIP